MMATKKRSCRQTVTLGRKVMNKHHQRIRTRRNKYRIIGMDECKRCRDHTSLRVQVNYPTHGVHVAMTKSQRFDESKQSSSNCKNAMHDLDGAGDQDIVFGHARDEMIVYSLTTSIGKDLTDSHKNSDVQRLQPECNARLTMT